MNAVTSKTFKSGNSIALRLPRALGIAADVEMRIERDGETLIVRPARDAAAEKAKVGRLVASLAALPAPGDIQARDPIDFPDRPGLI